MGKVTDKAKDVLDWLRRGYFVAQLLGSIGAGKALQAVLVTYTHIPPIWVTPLWLLTAAAVMVVLVAISKRIPHSAPQMGGSVQTQKSLSLVPPSTGGFNAAEFFRTAYHSPLQVDIENRISDAANVSQPQDREGFYLRFIGVGALAYTYDLIWYSIYRSQILFLLELNRKNAVLPLAAARSFYDAAAKSWPGPYANYSFDKWMAYMVVNILVLRHPSEMIELTMRGKDFLKFLLHWGRDADQRRL